MTITAFTSLCDETPNFINEKGFAWHRSKLFYIGRYAYLPYETFLVFDKFGAPQEWVVICKKTEKAVKSSSKIEEICAWHDALILNDEFNTKD